MSQLRAYPQQPLAGDEIASAIRDALTAQDVEQARELFAEYARWLGEDLCFQGFASELAGLPGEYAPPRGRLLLAGPPGGAFGCVALRALDERVGEIKRMYVQPARRGEGWGRRLAIAIVAQAHALGYRELVLDTLSRLVAARAVYAELGFEECAPYYVNPLAGVVYMRLKLAPGPSR